MIERRSWREFRESGLLWWVNRGLHLFGWAIVYDFEKGADTNAEPASVYVARTKFRGFGKEADADGFKKLTGYMQDHAEELLHEL